MPLAIGTSSVVNMKLGTTDVIAAYLGDTLVWSRGNLTLTVICTEPVYTVVLTAPGYTQVGNTISVPYGTEVTYTVSSPNCTTVTGTYTVYNNEEIEIELEYLWDYTIVSTGIATLTKYNGSETDVTVPLTR